MTSSHPDHKLYDVVIVGSGPAGSAAALKLAKQGAHVAVLEKEELPRYKVCGGGVTRRARKLMGVDIREAIEYESKEVVLSFLNSDLRFTASSKEPVISMVMRARLDALLMQYAVDEGAELHASTVFKSVESKSEHLEIRTDKSVFYTRFLIGADGAKSPVAKSMGWKETRHLIPAIESEVFLEPDVLQQFSSATRFDFDVIPDGYSWVFPKGSHLSIGLCTVKRGSSNLKQAYADYKRRLKIDTLIREDRHGYVIPFTPRTDGFTRDRVLLVGDSAGFADPVTAEGISYAVYSGQLAAQALVDARFDEQKALMLYEEQIAQNLLPEIKAARWLTKLLYSPEFFRNRLFSKRGNQFSDSVMKIFKGEDSYQQVMYRHLYFPRMFGFDSRKPGFLV
jgi:geranylgeranyl reductase family protein